MFGKKTPTELLSREAPTLAGTLEVPEDQVHLEPILGIRPGVYLAGLFTLILLALLFFIFLFPGLTNPGSLLVLDSEPRGAAVRIDGITLGATPCEVFVSQGSRSVELTLPGFVSRKLDIDAPGRILGSRLFPHRIAIAETLAPTLPLEALFIGASEYAAWSFTGEPTAAYQIPRDLSEGAYRSGPAAADPLLREGMDEILKEAARYASTKAAQRDLLRALFLSGNGGLSPSPLTFTETASGILSYLSELEGAAPWLTETLSPESARSVEGSGWYREAVSFAAALSGKSPVSPVRPLGASLRLDSLSFREIPGGSFIQGTAFPRELTQGSFYIATTEIDSETWEHFLRASPRWGRENRKTLISEGLVSEGYLEEPIYPPYPKPGVPGISWYAAAACCQWLTTLLPPGLREWEVRLPTEAEWEYAAKLGAGDSALPRGTSLEIPQNMIGGLWEWCADYYAPLNYLPGGNTITSPERSLKGGSWINPPGSVGMETRASLAPATSSAFVSFRPVIAPLAAPKAVTQ
ncbi:conserved hypothetical protein [Treponema primitia ZAS-2]|uniref:PEGA domain-containing protein n=1 Tax=Treponema primitia (strain ATCC BAA-887 / DSM 12427 / ZAS-2) TaxID=545694 RepID=F5YH16_TREPZ|nr:SUMF1/EgtB/PvdO family nonheme iron enzyme [Treponema primitia]AEF84000.1 conserved hypothetical protein [Treponema primitia ZAS-2]